MKLRFRVLLGDSSSSLVSITSLSLGTNALPSDNCLALASDTALISLGYRCGDPLLYEFMRGDTMGVLRVTHSGDDMWASVSSGDGPVVFTIFDMLGRPVAGPIATSSNASAHFNVSNAGNGLYFLRAATTSEILEQKILVRR